MNLNYNTLEKVYYTSFWKLMNYYITPLFITISTKLGTLPEIASGKLINQYVSSQFTNLLTIALYVFACTSVIGVKFVFSIFIESFNRSEGR